MVVLRDHDSHENKRSLPAIVANRPAVPLPGGHDRRGTADDRARDPRDGVARIGDRSLRGGVPVDVRGRAASRRRVRFAWRVRPASRTRVPRRARVRRRDDVQDEVRIRRSVRERLRLYGRREMRGRPGVVQGRTLPRAPREPRRTDRLRAVRVRRRRVTMHGAMRERLRLRRAEHVQRDRSLRDPQARPGHRHDERGRWRAELRGRSGPRWKRRGEPERPAARGGDRALQLARPETCVPAARRVICTIASSGAIPMS